jgi:hypothetical protein
MLLFKISKLSKKPDVETPGFQFNLSYWKKVFVFSGYTFNLLNYNHDEAEKTGMKLVNIGILRDDAYSGTRKYTQIFTEKTQIRRKLPNQLVTSSKQTFQAVCFSQFVVLLLLQFKQLNKTM